MVAAVGCGDEGAPAPRVIGTELATCDITTSPCQRGIYESVAESLDASGYSMPSIRTISVDQHADEVRSGLDLEDLTGEDAATRGLRLLGFIPEASESLTATQAEYWITQVAAYYSRSSNRITVIDRNYEQGAAQVLLAHEFIHSIQNSQFDLGTVGRGVDTEDGVIGVRSVIEGDAVHSSFAWYYDVSGYAPEDIDWDEIHDERTARLRDRVADPERALIDTASSFPYSYGFQLMTNTSLAEGLLGRAAAFEAPPATTLEVLLGYGAQAPVVDFPLEAHPSPVEGNEVAEENRYGAWYVYGFLRRHGVEDEEAWTTGLSWVGDELAIYDDGAEVAAVWRVRFDDQAKAELLSAEVNGEGGDDARSAVAFGEDAFVFAAESAETLLAWAEQPLDTMTASIIAKSARPKGGAVSVGTCLQSHDFSVPMPPPILR
ncbi:MAG: hypothetical protein JSV06_06460 [Myxococcales bacterium]|nr:MAG: hypothetical protein JSV06_06460 [Myxococcales bacterium]